MMDVVPHVVRENQFDTKQSIVSNLLRSLVYSFVNYQAQLNQESYECGGSVSLLHIILKIKCYMLVRTYIDQVSARSDEILALSMLISDNCLLYTRSQVQGIESKHASSRHHRMKFQVNLSSRSEYQLQKIHMNRGPTSLNSCIPLSWQQFQQLFYSRTYKYFPSESEHIFYSEPHCRKIPELKFRAKKILEVLQALE